MPDPKQDDNSRTGKYKPIDADEPKLSREKERSASLPELDEPPGSTTGILRAYHEGGDETAQRDEDQPAEQA